ncbi:hypothetical protein AXK11_08615 [Cephaloticoccus primus]|uniref:Aminoglycoside phosphotransferase domain-containing protein n=1 Tax=Cephaloticoccus primus TaxID=1548207 RepID=A0A139SIG7_9BACT|nr:aminoglycoside phosphotransferase family protein [Cephaloticoccus primus]KXU34362.1 hypothetical protein AXK11_08615 [Cephaloticoccus primus]
MPLTLDPEMAAVARQLWPAPQRLQPATGGLFNRVLQVQSPAGTAYLKRFTDAASSGDFPALPTSAAQRCLVAARWHELALRASTKVPQVAVPALISVKPELDLIAMEQARGAPLYDALWGEDRDTDAALHAVVAWQAALHVLAPTPRAPLLAASRPFKAFKVDLQYTCLLVEVPPALHAAARDFVAAYLQQEAEPVHGDLNSRNILIGKDGVSVIDFEQGHFGEGVYDLAYLLSEYVIRELRAAADPEPVITAAWAKYCQARGCDPDPALWRRLRIHLGFQVLYRLVGPSCKVWTGHLGDTAGQALRRWSTAEFLRWL